MSFSLKANTPFTIGSLKLQNRLIQAPLAGISCAPFRELFSLYVKPAYAVTEMISAQSIMQHKTLNKRYLSHSLKEGPWAIQLSGHDPDFLSQAVKIAETYKPALIDLNCGCPKPKIRGKGSGSALMDTPKELERVVMAMRQSTTLPLTVKIRTAGNTSDDSYLEAAAIIEQCGADAIIVHGRHHSEGYDVAANYQQINKIVQRVNIPVIANGDVSDQESMLTCFEKTGAEAVMIARAGIGKPWLYQQLLTGADEPIFSERVKVFTKHIEGLAQLENSEKIALLQGRRLLKWYFDELSNELITECYEASSLKDLAKMLIELQKKTVEFT